MSMDILRLLTSRRRVEYENATRSTQVSKMWTDKAAPYHRGAIMSDRKLDLAEARGIHYFSNSGHPHKMRT